MLVEPVVKIMSMQRLAVDLVAVLGVLVCVHHSGLGCSWTPRI